MPNKIKKFDLTYDQIPNIFNLPSKVFLNDTAKNISSNKSISDDTKQKYIDRTIFQLKRDLSALCYVDFKGNNISTFQKDWLTLTSKGTYVLNDKIYPNFTQGDNTGAVIGHSLYSYHVMPYVQNMEEIKEVRFCFSYKNTKNQASGFAFIAWGNKSEDKYEHWIISTIQNATAAPNEKKITVLASQNSGTPETDNHVLMDNVTSITQELNSAINEGDVSFLMKNMFNADNSLNSAHIDYLNSRIVPNQNIDDRYRKEIQLNTLFALAKSSVHDNF